MRQGCSRTRLLDDSLAQQYFISINKKGVYFSYYFDSLALILRLKGGSMASSSRAVRSLSLPLLFLMFRNCSR
jgi:hypothetical protein